MRSPEGHLRPRRLRSTALLAVAAMTIAACGESGTSVEVGSQAPATIPTTSPLPATIPTTAPPPAPTSAPATAAPPADGATGESAATTTIAAAPEVNLFPDVEVVEVISGEPRQLADLGASDRPVLLWFWAPH